MADTSSPREVQVCKTRLMTTYRYDAVVVIRDGVTLWTVWCGEVIAHAGVGLSSRRLIRYISKLISDMYKQREVLRESGDIKIGDIWFVLADDDPVEVAWAAVLTASAGIDYEMDVASASRHRGEIPGL